MMNRNVQTEANPLVTQFILFALLLWAGMVMGISFVEAPIKFTAPQVTLAIGLGIGRLVFGWLNKFELFFGVVLLAGLYFNRATFRLWLPALLLSVILIIQSVCLLPALDNRALQIIAGQHPGESNLHFEYVTLEIFKLGLLLGTAAGVYRAQFKASQPAARRYAFN